LAGPLATIAILALMVAWTGVAWGGLARRIARPLA
jgi:hypothetical protein